MGHDQRKSNPSGIEIAAPRLIEPTTSKATGAILDIVLILLGVFGTAWCFISAFSLPVLPRTMVMYTLLFVGVFVVISYLDRLRPFILLVFMFLYATAAYLWSGKLVQGFLIITNQVMVTYARHSDYTLPTYIVSAAPEEFQSLCTIFVLFAVCLLTIFLCGAIIRRRSFWLTFLATFPFLLAALAFTITPSFFAVWMLAACWAALFFMRLTAGKKHGFVKIRRLYHAKSADAATQSGFLMIPAVALCFALILTIFPSQSYQRSERAESLRGQLTENLSNLVISGGGNAWAGSTEQVYLNHVGSVRFTGKTMLRVQASPEFPTYLKSFSGSTYTGLSWEKLPDSAYREINPKLKGLTVQNMSHTFFSLFGRQANVLLNPYEIRVKNISASKQCIYAPYNLVTTPKDITGVKFINDAFIQSGYLFGTGEYNLYAYGLSSGRVDSDVASVFLSAAYGLSFFDNPVDFDQLPANIRAYLSDQSQFSRLRSSNLEAYYKSTLPQDLMQMLTEDKRNFVQAEQDYRLFMYDPYTQLPESTREKVQILLREEGLQGNSRSVGGMVSAVQSYLRRDFSYTLDPGRVPNGQDFTEYFLFENRKGYCVHFATAATVMLRAMGVPARYAEGYIVTRDDYKNAVGGWANIKDNRAHAWVEVYYPGLGWQPVEVTPGFNVAENRTQDANPQDETPPERTPETDSEDTPDPVPTEPETSPIGQQADDGQAAMMPILITLSVIAGTLIVIILRRRIALARRGRLFALEDTNKAAIGIYIYLTRLAKYGGEISEAVIELAEKACFSQHRISDGEIRIMKDIAETLAAQNYSSLPRVKRLVFKYIDNLV